MTAILGRSDSSGPEVRPNDMYPAQVSGEGTR